ncbi:MAG: hypothetical protein ACYSWO_28435 [Planctomycetota bacterium]|jgi:hypothetical protein
MAKINGILGRISCSVDGREEQFELALGEDGKIYSISQELVDSVESYEAGLALGLSKLDLIEDDNCLLQYLTAESNPNLVICQSTSIPDFVMGYIAWEWLKNTPFCYDDWKFTQTPEACRAIQEIRRFVREYFQGGQLFPRNLFYKAKEVALELQNKKKFAKHIGKTGMFWLKAFEKFSDIGIAIEGDHQQDVGQSALSVSYLMEMSQAKNPIFMGYERETKRSARISQVKNALRIINDFDAWDVEIDID